MKEIKLEDCKMLKKKFDCYASRAEQNEFLLLFIIDSALEKTLKKLQNEGEVKDQKEARAMFRSVLKVIGEDYSEYEEEK